MPIRTNHATNPRFAVSITGTNITTYGPASIVKTLDNTKGVSPGTTSLKMVSGTNGAEYTDGGMFYNLGALTAGTYTVSAYIATQSNGAGGGVQNVHFIARSTTGAGVLGNQIHLTDQAGAFTRQTITFTLAGTDTVELLLGFGSYGATSQGTAWFTNILVEQSSTLGDYFDGDSIKSGYTYAWTGTANDSKSTETPPNRLSDNSFETGISGWEAYGGSRASSTAFARTGTKSLALTAVEPWAGTYYFLNSGSTTELQTFSAWIRGNGSSVGKNVNILIKNETTGATQPSSSITLSTSWQLATISYTPPDPANISVHVQGSNLANGDIVYIDDVEYVGGEIVVAQTPTFFEWKGYLWERRDAATYGHGQPTYNGNWAKANIPDPTEDGLVLKLTNPTGTNPVAAEIRSVSREFGYGTYISVVNTNLSNMHPSIVFGGLFTFNEHAPPAYQEVDVHETSAWGGSVAGYGNTVQLMHNMWRPSADPNIRYVEDTRMAIPAQALQTHRLIWEPGKMTVDSFLGEGTTGTNIFHHEFTNVPVPSQTRVHYNIWVIDTPPATPSTATPIDVTVKDFSYTPFPNTVTTREWHDYGIKPSKTTAQLRILARQKYDDWMNFTLTTSGMPDGLVGAKRIQVPDQGFYNNPEFNGTVSEGQAYGMLMKAWFSNPALGEGIYDPQARADFDMLFKYYNHYKNVRGLMHWNITNAGVVADSNGATDGDLDAAMALVIMSRLWPSDGEVNYTAEATELINAIRDYEFVPATGVPGTGAYPNIITNGDGWGFATNNIMPDYFRPGFLREFYYHTNDARWLDIINANYTYALQYYHDNYQGGLVPDRQTREHTSLGAATDKATYNSVRLGFGVMYDYLWNGSSAPILGLNMMNKMANKAKANFATGANIKAPEYDLDFNTWQAYSNLSGYGLVGPAALGSAANQTFSTEIVDAMAATTEFTTSYFNGGVGLMALMAMSGIGQNYRVAATNPTSGYIKVYNGTQYVMKPIKVWNGTSWVIKPLKRYNSNSWENTN